jgi:hypothetical protein
MYGARPGSARQSLRPSLLQESRFPLKGHYVAASRHIDLHHDNYDRTDADTGGISVGSTQVVTDSLSTTRAYALTDLTNGIWYTVTLNAMLDATPFLTDTVRVMPTEELIYLPLVLKA